MLPSTHAVRSTASPTRALNRGRFEPVLTPRGFATSPFAIARQCQFMWRRLILWYSMLGAYDQAYEVVDRSLDDLAATGTIGVGWGFLWLRELAGLRQDARFAALAVRMRLPDYWQRYRPPDGYDWRDGRLVAR